MSAETTNPQPDTSSSPTSAARIMAGHARCKVCQSPDRVRVELMMAKGSGKRAAARAFGLSEASVWRHWENHVTGPLKKSRLVSILKPGADLETLINEEGGRVVDTLKVIRAGLMWRYDQLLQRQLLYGAEGKAGLDASIASIVAQLHRNAEIWARLSGDLVNRTEVTIKAMMMAPEYLTMRHELTRVLQPYPEVLFKVTEALRKIEGDAAGRSPPIIEGKVA